MSISSTSSYINVSIYPRASVVPDIWTVPFPGFGAYIPLSMTSVVTDRDSTYPSQLRPHVQYLVYRRSEHKFQD